MDARVSKLETHIEYISRDLAEIKETQKEAGRSLAELASALKELPTKKDMSDWELKWLAIALATFISIVGGIIGGLDWIKTH